MEAREGSRANLVVTWPGDGRVLGRSLRRGDTEAVACTRALVVLKWDVETEIYYVLTSYRRRTDDRDHEEDPGAVDPRDYPALRDALRGYLHEDWTTEYADSEDAARAFRRDAAEDEASTVAAEAKKLRRALEGMEVRDLRKLLGRRLRHGLAAVDGRRGRPRAAPPAGE